MFFARDGVNLSARLMGRPDPLSEYCQWSIARITPAGRGNLRLHRGVNKFAEHETIERIDKRTLVVRQNNLVSFSSGRKTADRFGDTILEVEVPLVKDRFVQ